MKCVSKNLLRRATAEYFRFWSWRRESNPRPSDYKSDALPTELRQQTLGKDALPRKLIPRIPSRCPGQLYKVPQRQDLAQQKYSGVFSRGQFLDSGMQIRENRGRSLGLGRAE